MYSVQFCLISHYTDLSIVFCQNISSTSSNSENTISGCSANEKKSSWLYLERELELLKSYFNNVDAWQKRRKTHRRQL